MAYPRTGHTASVLRNGKILVVGGGNSDYELYDPSTDTWTVSWGNIDVRSHTASLLTIGKALVTGGYNNSYDLNSAELYDPPTGTWLTTNNMNSAQQKHTATVLPSGKVLAAGSGDQQNSAELYDPLTETWKITESMNYGRWGHTASLLANGTVLITGGFVDASNSVELYYHFKRINTETNSDF